MTADQLNRYRERLWQTVLRLQHDASLVSKQVFGDAGSRSREARISATTHLDDLGAESYQQDLNATLLENEEQLANEALAAIGRIDEGIYGRCENCGRPIVTARLDAIPATRYCTPCAENLQGAENLQRAVNRPRRAKP